jgi:hypothetical protein
MAVPLSIAAQAILNFATTGITNAYQSATTFKVDTTWSKDIYPLGGDAGSYTFLMHDVDGAPIAELTVEIIFKRTLRNSPELVSVADYPDMSQQLLESPSFMMLDSTGVPQELGAKLAANAVLSNDLQNPADSPRPFYKACDSSRAFLQNAGLNLTDSTFWATRYLSDVVNDRQDLATSFWTKCMPGRQNIADGIGVSDAVKIALGVTSANAASFGNYIKHKSAADASARATDGSKVVEMLAGGGTIWQPKPDPLSPAQVLAALAALPATDFYCNFSVPVIDQTTQRFGVTMFLSDGKTPDKVLALYSGDAADEGAPVRLIQYRDPTVSEMSACVNYRRSRNLPGPLVAVTQAANG